MNCRETFYFDLVEIFYFGIFHIGILILAQILGMKSIHNKAYQQLLELLRSKRVENGITQEELAHRLGVRQGIVSKIETHERRLDIIELRDICKAIGISFPEFIKQLDDCITREENQKNEETQNL